jgi:hypothetical protein
MDTDGERLTAGTGYPLAELARAFATAARHEDAATRDRAESRVRRWSAVLRGMMTGALTIGTVGGADAKLRRLGELALDGFPATLLPGSPGRCWPAACTSATTASTAAPS